MTPGRPGDPGAHDLCREAVARVQELVDGELPSDELLAHLESCPPCAMEAESVREIKRAVERVGSDVDDELLSRLRAWADRLPNDPD